VSKRLFSILLGLAVLAVIAGVGLGVLRSTNDLGFGPTGDCTATVDGYSVDVTGEQAENATLIASIAMRRGMPARATSIALATAMQESKLTNLTAGDRDSVGLFQQRPSQGWGSRKQLLNRVYATNRFFDALEKVRGYESMDITVAAQRVQRSAYPDAYAAHEDDARTLASALTGYSPAAFTCDLSGAAPTADAVHAAGGLSGRAIAVRHDLRMRFGGLDIRKGPHGDGTVLLAGISGHAERSVYGWALAQYLVGNASRLQIRSVGFDHKTWHAGGKGWESDPGVGDSQVRVEVFS